MIFFIHLPRTGGTFVHQYSRNKQTRLKRGFNYYPNNYSAPKHSPASSIPNPKDFYLFGLIRNPFDWYVSRYHYFIDKPKKGITQVEDTLSQYSDAGLLGVDFENRFRNVNEHIKFGYESGRENFWLSWLHDYMFCDKDGQMLMNHVGKMENMNEELNFVLWKNNLSARVPIEDFWGYQNRSERKSYHEELNWESREIIEEKDKKIFDLYGYTW